MYGDNGYMKELPAEIENLINLKKLSIAVEILKCLPKEIGNLINLEYLEIDSEFEDFNGIPKEIGNLKNLKTLKIARCKGLKELPKEIFYFTNL